MGATPQCECHIPLLPHFKSLKSGNNLQPWAFTLHIKIHETLEGETKSGCEGPPKLHAQIVGDHPIPFGINTTRKIHCGATL